MFEGKGMGRCIVSSRLHFLRIGWLGDGIVVVTHRKQNIKQGVGEVSVD